MVNLGSLLLLVGSIIVPITQPARPLCAMNIDNPVLIQRPMYIDLAFVIHRSAGLKIPAKAFDYYEFTVRKNGNWEFTAPNCKTKRGKLDADDLDEWVKDIEDGGLYEVESNPELGALDEAYMDIAINTWPKETRVRIHLAEKLSQRIEKRIVELVEPEPR